MRKKKTPIIVIKTCEGCSISFEVNAAYKRQGLRRFCSLPCARVANGKANKGRKCSEESKKRRSVAQKGKGNPFYGKTHSAKTRRLMSENKLGKSWNEIMINSTGNDVEVRRKKQSDIMTGQSNPFYGKKHSAETKAIISENHSDVSGQSVRLREANGLLIDEMLQGIIQYVSVEWHSVQP